MTITDNITEKQKEAQKNHIKSQILKAQEHVKKYIDERKKVEDMYDKYFAEISKHSSEFKLVKTPQVFNKTVNVFQVDEEGLIINGATSSYATTISESHNQCSIMYDGKLPEFSGLIQVIVEEHVTYGKRGWGRTNHGFKMKLRFGYNDEKQYYKTGKNIVNKTKDYVESLWIRHNNKINEKQFLENALLIAKKKFKDSYVRVSNHSETLGGYKVPVNHIVVENPNRTMVAIRPVRNENEIELRLVATHIPFSINSNVEKIVDSLRNINNSVK